MQVLSVIKKCYGNKIVEWDIVNQDGEVVIGGYQSLIKAVYIKCNMRRFKDITALKAYIEMQRINNSIKSMGLANG